MPMSEEKPVAAVRTRRSKVRIPARCTRFVAEIDNYIHRYDLRGESLASAACDVLDGWATREELEPLVRRRLLSVDRYCAPNPVSADLCGRHFTVHLTARAMGALWPDRLRSAASSARRRARTRRPKHG